MGFRPRTRDDRLAALERGAEAEEAVGRELERSGWTVMSRNWHGGGGEIDLIVRRDGAVRFVEVKARDDDDPSGIEAIDEPKQHRLIGAAEAWLSEHGSVAEACFLVVVVSIGPGATTFDWFDNAFDGAA